MCLFHTAKRNKYIRRNGSGFYKSSNNGTNWVLHNDGFINNTALIHSVLIINGYIMAGTEGWGIYRRPMLEVIGIQNISTEIPDKYKLYQNYPNPFNLHFKFEICYWKFE